MRSPRGSWGLAGLLLSGASCALAHTVGNPGDPVRLVVREALADARVMLIRVNPDRLDSPPVAKSYKEMRSRMQVALATVRLEWLGGDRPHCAEAFAGDGRITFSYPRCHRTVRNKVDAVRLLLHEAVHLAGSPDETLADDVAHGVYSAWLKREASRELRWHGMSPEGKVPAERTAHASVAFRDGAGRDRLLVWGGCYDGKDLGLTCSAYRSDGAIYDLAEGRWQALPPPPAGAKPRAGATAVYTGSEGTYPGHILIYGGCYGTGFRCDRDVGTVLDLDLATKVWKLHGSLEAPEARSGHQAVWTPQGMIVWGGIRDRGSSGRGRSLNSGGIFDPAAGSWRPLPAAGAPSPRRFASAVWTGRRLIVFGGCDRQVGRYCPRSFNDGVAFHLAEGRWETLPPAPLRPRSRHSAVWTGEEMIVWGGMRAGRPQGDGAIYRPATEEWTPIGALGPGPRFDHGAVWTGDRMVVWGGRYGVGRYAAGLSWYHLPTPTDPLGRWHAPQVMVSPVARAGATVAWTGRHLVVWGGESLGRAVLSSGALFSPWIEP